MSSSSSFLLFSQTNRKRKQHSSSGHANSTGTGNTVGPSPSSPQSTHTPGDGMTSMSKGLIMYGEGTGGIASSTNQLVILSVIHANVCLDYFFSKCLLSYLLMKYLVSI